MSLICKKNIVKHRLRFLQKRHRFLKNAERKRYMHIYGLRLRQRLRLDICNWNSSYKNHLVERKKRRIAKRETAKLNRTLKRRRKR